MRLCLLPFPLAAALALALTSCVPTYQLSVRPAAAADSFHPGDQTHLEAQADSVAVALRFAGYEPEWLVFEVEYHNDSRRTLELAPTAFSSLPRRLSAPAPGPAAAGHRRVRRGEQVPAAVAAQGQPAPWLPLPTAPLPALDPEATLRQLDAQAEAHARRAARPDWLGLALLVVSVGADVSAATRRTPETRSQWATRQTLHQAAWTASAVAGANRASHALTADLLAAQAARLREGALRPTRLGPGQQARGYLYLPRFDQADGLRVFVPLGPQPLPFDFVQTHQRQ